MSSRTVINGNAFYEIDEECMALKRRYMDQQEEKMEKEKQTGKSTDLIRNQKKR